MLRNLEKMKFLQKINNKNCLLLKEQVEKILKSGLLLDEDLEKVLDIYDNFNEAKISNESIDAKYVIIGSVLFVPLLCILTNSIVFFTIITVLLLLIILLIICLMYLDRILKRNFDVLLTNLSRIYKITVTITKYMKHRNDVAKLKLNPPIATIQSDFIYLATSQKCTHVQFLKDCIEFVKKYLQEFPNNQQNIENLNDNLSLISSIKTQQIQNIDDVLTFEETLKDVSILITSLFLYTLSYLYGLFATNNTNLFVYNYRLSRISYISLKYVSNLQNKFDKIQYKYIIKGKPNSKDIVDVFNRNNIRDAAIQSIKTASLLFETVNNFYEKLQNINIDNVSDKELISLYLENLQHDAYEYYKTVDIWCNIYSISIKNQEKQTTETSDEHIKDEKSQNVYSVEDKFGTIENVEDLINAMNEEYYEGEGNEEAIKFEDSIDDIDKLKQFKMLYMELKHKLKTNRRFKEAQQRRGVQDINVPIRKKIVQESSVISPPLGSQTLTESSPPPPPPLPPVFPTFGHQDNAQQGNDNGLLNSSISDRNIRDAIMEVIKRQSGSKQEDTFEHDPEELSND